MASGRRASARTKTATVGANSRSPGFTLSTCDTPPLSGAGRRMAWGFDRPQQQQWDGEGLGPAQRRASTDPAGFRT
jgi:hypothetical protein